MKKLYLCFIFSCILSGCFLPTRYNYFTKQDNSLYFPISENWYGYISLCSREQHEPGFSLRKESDHSLYAEFYTDRDIKTDVSHKFIFIENMKICYSFNREIITLNINEFNIVDVGGDPVSNELEELGVFKHINKTYYMSVSKHDGINIPFEVKEIKLEFDLVDNKETVHSEVTLLRKSKIAMRIQME